MNHPGACASKFSVSDTCIFLHIPQTGARFRETGARLRILSNAVKAWLIAHHECVAVRILCVARGVEILEIQAIAKFKSGRPHQHTHHHHRNRAVGRGRTSTKRLNDRDHGDKTNLAATVDHPAQQSPQFFCRTNVTGLGITSRLSVLSLQAFPAVLRWPLVLPLLSWRLCTLAFQS
jgi:hypothetical protein